MKDLIERQDIIKELESWLKVEGYSEGELNIIKAVLYELQSLPSAQPDLNEWCTDCKEYDKEKHHCPRFNRVIREALKDAEPRKTGKWIRNDNGTWSCNKCSSWIPDEQHYYANYCLYCGADMRGEQNEQPRSNRTAEKS